KNRPTPVTEWTARGGRRDGRPLRNDDDEGGGGAAHEPRRIPPPTRGVDAFGSCDPTENAPDRSGDHPPSLSTLAWEGVRAPSVEVARPRPRGDRRPRVRGLVLLPEDRSRAPGRDQEHAGSDPEHGRGRDRLRSRRHVDGEAREPGQLRRLP